MFQDELIQSWLAKYDNLTSFSFMAFLNVEEELLQFISKGLHLRLMIMNETGQFAIVHDTVDEQTAKALGTYQGTSFSLIFPGKYSDFEDLVKTTVLEGMEFLRIKVEYLGMTEAYDYV